MFYSLGTDSAQIGRGRVSSTRVEAFLIKTSPARAREISLSAPSSSASARLKSAKMDPISGVREMSAR